MGYKNITEGRKVTSLKINSQFSFLQLSEILGENAFLAKLITKI